MLNGVNIKSFPTDSLPKVMVADLTIKNVIRCAPECRMLTVQLPGASVNYAVACAPPSLLRAVVLVKGTAETKTMEQLTAEELTEFAKTMMV